jgi:hypothetical protein
MAKPVKTAKSPAVLITRIVVFGALAVLLVLAGLDYRAKNSAQATADAFRKAIDDNPEVEILKSQLTPLIQGSPAVSAADPSASGSKVVGVTGEAFTWKGILRNYTVYVGYGTGDDPSVENINGPVSGD